MDLLKLAVKTSTSANVTINHDNWKVLMCKTKGKKWGDLMKLREVGHKNTKIEFMPN